jgi:hypothetical protein
MQLQVQEGHYTVLGNITSSSVLVHNAPLADPWAALNRQLP